MNVQRGEEWGWEEIRKGEVDEVIPMPVPLTRSEILLQRALETEMPDSSKMAWRSCAWKLAWPSNGAKEKGRLTYDGVELRGPFDGHRGG